MTQLKSLVMQSRVNPAAVRPRPKLNLISVASFENVDDDEVKRMESRKSSRSSRLSTVSSVSNVSRNSHQFTAEYHESRQENHTKSSLTDSEKVILTMYV